MQQNELGNNDDEGVPLSRPNIHKVAIVHTHVVRENTLQSKNIYQILM